jgi:O-antigen/teichoic acid export membrane protein
MIADMHHRGHMERLQELFRITTKWGLYISLPLFVVICLAPYDLLWVLFGEEYVVGVVPLLILSAGQLVNLGSGAVGHMLIMTGHQNNWFVSSTIAFFINFVLNLLLIPLLGIAGSALATAVATSTLFITGLLQVRAKVGLWPYDRRYIKGGIAILVTTMALLILKAIGIDSPLVRLILMGGTAVTTFAITLLAQGLDKEDKDFLNLLLSRIRKQQSRKQISHES